MNAIKDLFQQAQLAEATYANFLDSSGILLTNPDDIVAALTTGDGNFSSAQARAFVTQWRVVDHTPDSVRGFSATLFEGLNDSGGGTGEFSLAIQGAEPISNANEEVWLDWFDTNAKDILGRGIAIHQGIDLYNYWQSLITSAESRKR